MSNIFKNKSVRYGIPFLVFVIGAPFLLNEFQQLRFQYKPLMESDVVREEIKKRGIKMRKPGDITLESEYEKIKDNDTRIWEIKRIPRPWEEEENVDKN
ncbi:cytochrome c oxidase assembly protein COX16 homolog, mitochondrial [Leptopilina boulardi]|uniref:cytochrome c oxidase assembly protein COX16 homolog, mitochondrial n=1 Tax=Leptopilina boulardi TaxID=63433 RepID=UPI0021F67F50|nr:cytochrome c oxidase assembly protein COX16 homolog, mitochondrial [Leptopilina boulardi]XP_051155747.1 cytochrome c oxidase assembly protein COX16 homolog, mitochondrial [Leptopilina boulardi]XP_051155748.1 cytochrome c oxidase assembly protein COX16 homolog, mitochondrial [Leptopilina boulardi]XP_051155750.1 cytochrome c oxidase assembly protein COX16 homolog, mitochondrial [Leptopilina boulardi]